MNLTKLFFASLLALLMVSCGDDDDLRTMTYTYDFNTGQVAEAFAYSGSHASNLSATILLEEKDDGKTDVTVSVLNSMDGQTYHTHAHDMADATTTPNGTPYSESPNSDVFVMALAGNGGTVSGTNTSDLSFDAITTTYDGFFVIHDPLQAVTTVDPMTYVILGVFAR